MAAVVGFLIISFGIWGIGDIFRGFGVYTVAKVGRSEISIDQFRYRYNEQLQQLGRQVGRPITPDQARALGIEQQVLSQLIAVRLMASVEHVRQLRRQELTPRRDLLLEVLGQRVPSWSWRRPKGGLFVWVQLPEGDARDLAQEALHRGVIVTPGITLSVDGSHTAWLRIPFLLPPDRLQLGLERLIEAWEHYSK